MLFLDNTRVYCHTVCTNNTIKETRTRANIIALTPSTLYTANQFHRLKPLSSKFHKPKHQGKPPHKKGQNTFKVHRLNLSITNKNVCLQFPKNRKFIFSFRKMFLRIGLVWSSLILVLISKHNDWIERKQSVREGTAETPATANIRVCLCMCSSAVARVCLYVCVCVCAALGGGRVVTLKRS